MKTTLHTVALLATTAFTAWTQPASTQIMKERSRNERFETNFFPPQLLMENQRALGLTEDQKTVIKSEIQKAQTKFTDVEWQLKTESETMEEILKNDKVDELLTAIENARFIGNTDLTTAEGKINAINIGLQALKESLLALQARQGVAK